MHSDEIWFENENMNDNLVNLWKPQTGVTVMQVLYERGPISCLIFYDTFTNKVNHTSTMVTRPWILFSEKYYGIRKQIHKGLPSFQFVAKTQLSRLITCNWLGFHIIHHKAWKSHSFISIFILLQSQLFHYSCLQAPRKESATKNQFSYF